MITVVVPTVVSLIALVLGIAELIETRKANKINEVSLRLEVRASMGAEAVGTPLCFGGGMTIPLTWRIQLYNNSAQPVTIKSAEFTGISNWGVVLAISDADGQPWSEPQVPLTIPARSFERFVVKAFVNAPRAYAVWYHKAGLCTNKVLDVQKMALKAGFTVTGGTPDRPSHAGIAASFRTADGQLIQSQAYWDDPDRTEGPDIKLPPQSHEQLTSLGVR